MSLTKKFATFVAPVALVAGFSLAANDAAAVEMGSDGCLPAQELMTQLKSEGQRSLITANSLWEDKSTGKSGRQFYVVTSNDLGNKGYSFLGDAPQGQPSSKFCLAGDFDNVKLVRKNDETDIRQLPSKLYELVRVAKADKNFHPLLIASKGGAYTVIIGNPEIKNAYNGSEVVGGANRGSYSFFGGFSNLDFSNNVNKSSLGYAAAPATITLAKQ